MVIWRDGALDFSAVEARAASTPARARELAAALPATYAVFDLLAHPDLGDVRGRPAAKALAAIGVAALGFGTIQVTIHIRR
ncbi:hypothetical protein [Streptomyces vinaceus]|uniref:hypothetical protein n=1 Tax=Streptomyces vinaceus TaxID=1960 RepID=UPI0035D55171